MNGISSSTRRWSGHHSPQYYSLPSIHMEYTAACLSHAFPTIENLMTILGNNCSLIFVPSGIIWTLAVPHGDLLLICFIVAVAGLQPDVGKPKEISMPYVLFKFFGHPAWQEVFSSYKEGRPRRTAPLKSYFLFSYIRKFMGIRDSFGKIVNMISIRSSTTINGNRFLTKAGSLMLPIPQTT